MSIEIPLTRGYVAIVDDDCPPEILAVKWMAHPHGKTVYAERKKPGTKGGRLKLHREILGLGPGDDEVDHIDGDGLNNLRENLRPCPHRHNMLNQGSRRGTSRYRGVSWYAKSKKWSSQFQFTDAHGKMHHLYFGRFESEFEAAVAFDLGALAAIPLDMIPFFRPNFYRRAA